MSAAVVTRTAAEEAATTRTVGASVRAARLRRRIVLNLARDLSPRLRVTDGLLADFTANLLQEYVSQRPPKLGPG